MSSMDVLRHQHYVNW